MPYDPVSICVAAAAALLFWAAYSSRRDLAWRVALVLLAALLLRGDAAWQRSLYPWDERYHALVAKHLAANPLEPTLYQRPLIPSDHRDWQRSHIWLHKPPAALWLMAGSMRLFGVDEIAMRLPSLLLATGAVLLTFLIGRLAFGDRVALLAAGFHAVNAFLVELAAGRRGGDHTDTALIFFVELGIWAALRHGRDRRVPTLLLAGVALGLGVLSKSLPALLVLPVAFAIFLERGTWTGAFARTAAVALIGALVVAPWAAYAWSAFPREAIWTALYTLRHTSEAIEGHRRSHVAYLLQALRFMGELVWLPAGAAVVAAWRAPRGTDLRPLVVWILVPYVTFSLMSTRLPQYLMIAASPLFVVQAWFWWQLHERLHTMPGGPRRVALGVLLAALLVLPAKYLFEPTGVLEHRDRHPAPFHELRTLTARLRLPDAVIFNMPRPIEAMFYSPYTAYDSMPTADQVRHLRTQGIPIVIYQPLGQAVPVPSDWPVIQLHGIRPLPR